MENTSHLEVQPDVAIKDIGEEQIILNIKTGEYFRLNPTAADMVRLLRENLTVEEVATRMEDAYEVSREEALADILQLAAELVNIGVAKVS